MMKKKTISLLLALALCAGLAAPTSALGRTVVVTTSSNTFSSVEEYENFLAHLEEEAISGGFMPHITAVELTNVISEGTYEANNNTFRLYYVEAPSTITLLSNTWSGDLGSGVQKGKVNEDGSLHFNNNAADYLSFTTGNSGGVGEEFWAEKGSTYVLTEPGAYWVGCVEYNYSVAIIIQDSGTPSLPDSPSDWAAETVNAAISAGLVPESLQSKYTDAATRAEFCALAVALYETVAGFEIAERSTFNDTSDVNIEKMAGLGVVNGLGGGVFGPDNRLTREQAATMLSRLSDALGKPLTAQAPAFKDNASVSDWAFDAVGQMQATGIMTGVGDNTFSPATDYTREQSIITIMRLFDVVK